MRPPRPVDWAATGAARAAEDGQICNASAEAARTAAGGAAEDGPGAPLATTHGPSAEVLCDGEGCDVDMGNAAKAPVAAEAAGVRHDNARPAEALEAARRESTLEPG